MPRYAILFVLLGISLNLYAQTAQIGADKKAHGPQKLTIESIQYRAARCETRQITEFENNILNEGGLVYVYFTNTSNEAVKIRFFRMNGEDESYWRLNHLIAWDRCYDDALAPGASMVWEINGVTRLLAPEAPFDFSMVDRSEKTVGRITTKLWEDPVRISFIRIDPDLKNLEIHLRNRSSHPVSVGEIAIPGRTILSQEWAATVIPEKGQSIARVHLAEALPSASLLLVKVPVTEDKQQRWVWGHRRAFADAFPIGAWHGEADSFETQHQMHMDTCVKGGRPEDPFFREIAPKYGYYAMTHTGVTPDVDTLRALADSPWVRCFMIQDEPDWSIPSNIMLQADTMTRAYNSTKPTFVTLCRNIKFFEYAPIPDIAGQDHYCVTAPSSSKWKRFYGTALEETAWYTRDLKEAAEPKPVWIWTQGIADWGERPKRPVPTPDELASQLVWNLGAGAKGILWFNYSPKLAAKFPDAADAMKGWGRVLTVLRNDFLGAEPSESDVDTPDKVAVRPLVSWDKALLCINNQDYEIHPEAYPFHERKNVRIRWRMPAWIRPVAAVDLSPEGIAPVSFDLSGDRVTLQLPSLKTCRIILLLTNADQQALLERTYAQAVAEEMVSGK